MKQHNVETIVLIVLQENHALLVNAKFKEVIKALKAVGIRLCGPADSVPDRNKWVAARYDELMREGKHGHYESMFRVISEAIELHPPAPAEGMAAGGARVVELSQAWNELVEQYGWPQSSEFTNEDGYFKAKSAMGRMAAAVIALAASIAKET